MLEHVACELCGAEDTKTLFPSTFGDGKRGNIDAYSCTNSNFSQHGQIVRCNKCGLVFTNPREKESEIIQGYSKVVDKIYLAEKEGRKLTFEKSLAYVEKHKRGGRLLDVGCATGIFLELANNGNWETYGLEPSEWAASYAKEKLDLNVFQGTLQEANFPGEFFDVITMWDVLEHFCHPLNELKEINRILKEDGLLFFSTLNVESLFAKLMGKRWWWLMEMHLYYFSPKTITMLLRKAGFEPSEISSHTRIVRYNYLMIRLEHYNTHLARIFSIPGKSFKLDGIPIHLNFGDLVTVCARKLNS